MEHAPQRVSQDNRPHLLVSAWLTPPGGGSAVGAWTIQALRDTYDLTVLTWGAVDLSEVNRAFGTDLRPDDAQWMTAPGWLRRPASRGRRRR